jgi:non-specific serine/threonine protein kinase
LAESLTARFPNGIWFVDLAPVTEASRVVASVAEVLKLREDADKNLGDLVIAQIADGKVLLVLDNCEHLLSSCAEFVDNLLSSCSELRILATSREALNVQGEKVLALPPLSVPGFDAGLDLGAVQSADSVKLFVDRAQVVQNAFELTTENFVSVADICRRLDGIPLAIELAAARVKVLSIEQIITKLDDRFKLLSVTGRTMLPRHQTLRAVIEWSYDHLTAEEQGLIRALSVFAGGWTLERAASVAGGFDEFELLDLHSQLVDRSVLVVGREQGGDRRYSFLETVRQFLVERLNERGEEHMIREAHLEAMLNLAEQAYMQRITMEEQWAEVLVAESDNLRVALEFARTIDSERYLRLVGAIAWFWLVKAHLFEARTHLPAALASSAVEPSRPARARALWGAAQTLAFQGDASSARGWMDEALSTWRDLGDTREIALALEGIGWTHFFSSEDEEACAAFEECLRLQRASGDRHLIIRAMVGLAQVLVALGRTDEAKPMAREIIEFSKWHSDKRSEHFGWHYLADCELILENCRESLDLYKQSLVLAQAIGDKVEISFEVQGVAMSLAGLGETELAVQLAGAVRAEWDRIAVDVHIRFWDALLERYIGAARQRLGVEPSEREWSKGRSISFDEAVTLALEVRSPS